jgi:hypothetical protein
MSSVKFAALINKYILRARLVGYKISLGNGEDNPIGHSPTASIIEMIQSIRP